MTSVHRPCPIGSCATGDITVIVRTSLSEFYQYVTLKRNENPSVKAYKIHSNHQSEKSTRSYAELRENIYKAEYNDQNKDHKISPNEEDQLFIYEDEKRKVPEFNELLVPEIILHGEDDLETFSGEQITVRQVTGKAQFRIKISLSLQLFCYFDLIVFC